MTNQTPNPNNSNKPRYDLAERTAKFGEAVIDFIKTLPATKYNGPLVTQSIRAATSIGANYMEADAAESKKDFRHKIGLCKKESRESMHWLRMIGHANPNHGADAGRLWQEAHELSLIFAKIFMS